MTTGGISKSGTSKLTLLDSENADFNLTTVKTVLTHTPSTTQAIRCIGQIDIGDGTKNLDASGGNFELTVSVGSQIAEPGPQTIVFGTNARSFVETHDFLVPAGAEVLMKLKSPNVGDSDVDVTARLYGV